MQCSNMNDKSVPALQNKMPIIADGEFCYLSPYQGETATKQQIDYAVERLKCNYSSMSPMFWAELQSQVVKCGFTAERLMDAVDNIIQTNPYKEIRIAEIINFGKGAKLYTYRQMQELIYRDGGTTDEFEIVNMPDGRNLWKSKTGKY